MKMLIQFIIDETCDIYNLLNYIYKKETGKEYNK